MPAATVYDQIRTFDLFKNSPEEFVKSFAAMAQMHLAPPGTTILKQGDHNRRLFVLSRGQIQVTVDNEMVALLEKPGDVMGEISVLMDYPITASLVALTAVEYFEIQASDLVPHISKSSNDFGQQLYRSILTVLSDKIIKTNQKARRFEIANRDLTTAKSALEEANRTLDQKVKDRTLELESRNTELLASHRKFEELYSNKEMTFQRLKSLQADYLSPLRETLDAMVSHANSAELGNIEKAKTQVASSIEMLRPMHELYTTEQAIRSRRVLLAEDDRKQQIVAKLALSGTGVKLDVASTIEQAKEFLAHGVPYDIVFVSSKLAAAIQEIATRLPAAKIVLMASTNISGDLPSMRAAMSHISSIVSRHSEDRTFTVKNVATTASKLAAKDLFGLEKYMNWGVEVQARPVADSNARGKLIEGMQEHFSKLGVRSNIFERAAAVSEELLMNALYDAPTAPDGKAIYNHLQRTEPVVLQEKQQGLFRYACDGMLAAVSVSDPFGGFRLEILLNYLERNYAGASVVQEANKGGGGRGLHQIVEFSDLVVFNVQRKIRTEVIAFFNLDRNAIVETAKPSFHFFIE